MNILKHLLSSFILLFFPFLSLLAQTSINGKIVDAITNEPLIGATIFALDDGKGVVSNADGTFALDISTDNKQLRVSYIGYTEKIVTLHTTSPDSTHYYLISLAPLSIGLEEVLVEANRRTTTRQIDRQTFRASDFQTAAGGTAIDLLSKLPSVFVDPDGTVSIRGTSDFMVYLNGKPTQIEPSVLLGQLSTNQIESVDVISVPTSNYDAQGKGGIINIVTKKTGLDGLTISTNGLLGGGPWNHLKDRFSGFKQNDNRYGAGLNLMYMKDNVSLYGGLNVNRRNVNGSRTGDARILVGENTYRHMVASGERPEWYVNATANVGLDYALSDKSMLSAAYFYGYRREGRSAFYLYHNFYADANKQTISTVDRDEEWIYNPNTDNRTGQFQSVNVDFSHQFSKISELNFSALYEHSGLKRELVNANYYYNNTTNAVEGKELEYYQADDTPLEGVRLSVDYTNKFDDGSTLGIGLQPQFMNIQGDFKYDTLDLVSNIMLPYRDLENEIDLNRNVYAAYANYSGGFNTLNYIVGLRMEYTDQDVNILSADYFSLFDGEKKSTYQTNQFDLFHTLHVNWKPTLNDKFTFATSRRISRPPLKNMAPFLYRRHLEVYVVGDPELQPAYMLNMELSYGRRIGKHDLAFTGFYRGVNNEVFRVNTVTNENENVMDVTQESVLIRSYTNAGNSQSAGVELHSNIDMGKYAKFFIGGSLYNYRVQGDIFGYHVDNASLNWSVKSNMNVNITASMKLNVDFALNSATITAQGQNDLYYISNASLNYTPKKLTGWDFSLRVLDLLGSNNRGLHTRAFNKENEEIFYQETEYHQKGGIVELGFSYSFNNNKIKNSSRVDSSFGKEQF